MKQNLYINWTFKLFSLVFFLYLFNACQVEQVELAQLDQSENLEIKDYSPVYLYFRTIEIDTLVEVNEKDTISSTYWVFHVDKRFLLKQVVDEINKLQNIKEKTRNQPEASKTFYCFMNSKIKGLSYLDFTPIKYSYPNYFSTKYIKENPDYHSHFDNFTIHFKSNNQITINGFDMPILEMESYIKESLVLSNSTKKAIVYLNFNNNLSFENYLFFWQKIKRFDANLIELSPVHFVYDSEEIADCGCR